MKEGRPDGRLVLISDCELRIRVPECAKHLITLATREGAAATCRHCHRTFPACDTRGIESYSRWCRVFHTLTIDIGNPTLHIPPSAPCVVKVIGSAPQTYEVRYRFERRNRRFGQVRVLPLRYFQSFILTDSVIHPDRILPYITTLNFP
jgi:hypothetical protein